jgi:glycosyltransferase involved in cell wall biosynthesis
MSSWTLKIAHINDIAFVATTLAAEQRRRGIHATLIDPPKPGGRLPQPWKLLVAPARLPILADTARRARQGRVDLVHVHYATYGLVGALAGRPYVVHCHGSDIRGLDPASAMGRYVGYGLRRAAAVLYATPDLAGDARRFRADAEFLPNPIDGRTFAPRGVPDRDILMATSLHPVKGADVALRVLARVLEARPETTATVVLAGPLSSLARGLLGDRVRYVPARSHADMPALYNQHRLALGQFRLGILSQVELEAMASGLVVVAPLRYQDPALEPAPVRGSDDELVTAELIGSLLRDPVAMKDIGAQGRAWVLMHHGVDRVVDRLDEIYARALGPVRMDRADLEADA